MTSKDIYRAYDAMGPDAAAKERMLRNIQMAASCQEAHHRRQPLRRTLLLAADPIAKTVAATELPVSIFTSLLGVPFLLYLIIKPGRETR